MSSRSKKNKPLILFLLTVLTLSIILSVPSFVFAQEEEAEEEQPEPESVQEEVSFDVTYPEIKAKSGEAFEFKADILLSSSPEDRVVNLNWEAPEGWYVAIQPGYEKSDISALKLTAGINESLTIVASPLVKMEPGEYKIAVTATGEESDISATAELKAIITATYQLDMTTKTGRLNTELSTGKDNKYYLVLENKGSDSIDNITLSATAPENWNVTFDSKEIDSIAVGKTNEVEVTIKPPEETIAGDYMITFNANSENSTDSLDLRVTAKTPQIWGWIGIGIIVLVIVGVAVIFARLGRR